jgi:hypothetical protein
MRDIRIMAFGGAFQDSTPPHLKTERETLRPRTLSLVERQSPIECA